MVINCQVRVSSFPFRSQNPSNFQGSSRIWRHQQYDGNIPSIFLRNFLCSRVELVFMGLLVLARAESLGASTAFGQIIRSPGQAWLLLIMKNNVWPGRPLGMLIFVGFVMSLLISWQSGGDYPVRTYNPVCQVLFLVSAPVESLTPPAC